MRGFVGAGNFIVDFVKTVDRYPVEQTLANISAEAQGSGGAPYNVLKDLAQLGETLPLFAIGRLGDDLLADFVLEDCRGSGIDTRRLRRTPGCRTSYTLVMSVEGVGTRTFFHQRGANAMLDVEDFCFDGMEGMHLHFGYLLLLDRLDREDATFGTASARVLAAAREAGLSTSVDLVSEDSDRFSSLAIPALRHADIAFMNEFELARTTGIDVLEGGRLDRDRLAGAAKALNLPGELVVHWQGGAATVWRDEVVEQGAVALQTDAIASLAGCGDAFAAGYLMRYGRGQGIEDRLLLGVCSAAACATGATCSAGVGTEEECLALGMSAGFRQSTG